MAPPRAVLFDIDGVLAVSWEVLPGAAQAVDRVRRAGLAVAFLTNTTSRSRGAMADRLRTTGIDVDESEILTALRAAVAYLGEHHPDARCLLLSDGSAEDDLVDVVLSEDDPNLVLTGGAGPSITYDRLNTAYELLRDGAPLISMHKNLSWQTADGLRLDMGAFVLGLERAAGVEATVVGKPAPDFYRAALTMLGVGPGDAVMVGDDVEADVFGAQAVGIDGVLVRTGKFRPQALQETEAQPDHVIDSVADLPDLLGLPA